MKALQTITKSAIYLGTLVSLPSLAFDAQDGANAAHPDNTPSNLFSGTNSIFHNIANILVFLTAAIAVLVIIFGGLLYVTSTGDAARIKRAKDTILYGVVGLVVAILAYAIVAFVTGQFAPRS